MRYLDRHGRLSNPTISAQFWREVLGYETAYKDDDKVAIESGTKSGPVLLFLKVLDGKGAKNRTTWS